MVCRIDLIAHDRLASPVGILSPGWDQAANTRDVVGRQTGSLYSGEFLFHLGWHSKCSWRGGGTHRVAPRASCPDSRRSARLPESIMRTHTTE